MNNDVVETLEPTTNVKTVVINTNGANAVVTARDAQVQQVNTATTISPVAQSANVVPTTQNTDVPSMIDMYGEIITDKHYITNPAIARDQEINQMILTLITPDKSALLVGKPGIGKTAIVEGLAYRMQLNDMPNALKGYSVYKINTNAVPDAIKGWRIIKINIPALLGKINVNGTEVSKLQLLINEIDKVEKTILFIDEVHLLVAKNGGTVDLDFANMLKPYLDRGRILMIGATTSEEYESYILRDRAFVRRFIKIEIAELQGDDVVKVLMGTTPKFEKQMGVKLAYSEFQKEEIFKWLVEHTSEYKRIYEVQNRYPDICLTIISSAFSYAVFESSPEVKLKHIYLAMKNTKNLYPDAITKAIENFKVRFAKMLVADGIDPNKI